MELEVSQKTARLCKSLKLSPEEMAFADLCATGWEPQDAFIVAFHKGSTWVKRALKDEVEKLLASESVKNRMDETRSVLSKRQKEAIVNTAKKDVSDIVSSAMSKEQMLYDLQTAKTGKEVGSKEWIEINKMIVDVTRMKQDEVKDENQTIHYYLPIDYPVSCEFCLRSRCNECKYKKAYKSGE